MARKLNIVGDAQADLAGHGGEQRAVFVYQMDSYHYWERFLGRKDFTFGQFGENFTVEGLPDNEVCIGDRYRIGGAIFEVTQPRVTCYRVGIRMNEPRMPALLVAHHRPGFYFRVLQEGEVGAGDDIVKITDGPERISVAELTPFCICQDILANNCNARCGFLRLARVGRVRSKRCSHKTRAPKPRRGIRDSRMRNKRQHGPDFDRCESRIS